MGRPTKRDRHHKSGRTRKVRNTQQEGNSVAKIDTKDLFDRARELREAKVAIMDEQRANREVLRNLDDSSMLSEAESAELEEIYPVRTRVKGENGEDGQE
jgi:hypothetical protein